MERGEATELLGDLASQQWGLFTTAQARQLEIDSPDLHRLEKAGVLERMRHGVYAMAGSPLSPELEIKAQWLAIRPEVMAADRLRPKGGQLSADDAVISHTSAANLWGIGDLWPDGYHFTVQKRRRSRQPGIRFHRANLDESEWKIHPGTGLPITTVARTIADLADAGHEGGHLISLVSDAGSKDLVRSHDLYGALRGKEHAFGLDGGDEEGLYELLTDSLGETGIDPQVAEAIESSLQPIRASFSHIVQAIPVDAMMSEELKAAMELATEAIKRSVPPVPPQTQRHLLRAIELDSKAGRGDE